MHQIYTTSGFIIGSKPHGDAGKVLFVLTSDLGLISAVAQGIRLEKSKLRYSSQDYSFGTFSFVRGKEFWRLTSASEPEQSKEAIRQLAEERSKDKNTQELFARISLLLKRLLHGEEVHPEIFGCLEACQLFLHKNSELSEEEWKTLESLIVLRILHHLGYVGNDVQIKDCFGSAEITLESLKRCEPIRTIMNHHINKALRESHL